MEIIIAICALILGIVIGIFMGRLSAPKMDEAILKEKEEAFQLLTKEKVDAYEKMIVEKENSFRKQLEEKEETFQKLSADKQRSFEDSLKLQHEAHQRELENMKQNNSMLIDTMEKNHRQAIETLKNQFAESSRSMSLQLKTATEQMLKQRQEEFSESSGQKINQILEPLKLSLKAMQDKVTENTTRHAELGGKLSESIKNLLDHTESAQASADRLATLLKGNTKRQGEWGERILKELLESLNLKEGIHFEIQSTLTDEKGKTLKNEEGKMGRPDVILHLDQNKDVIIDSKVSLSAYMQYQEATSEEERQEALKKHISSIEKHVDELSDKNYPGYISKNRIRLGYVIMFVPNTSALLLATNNKSTLWREAMEKNVYIADEQTLYAALKIVSLTWQQILQNANHAKVFELADEMIERVAAFISHYDGIGENLKKVTKSFEEGKKKLEDGGHSIPVTCRKLIKLGAKVPKLPKGVDPSLFSEE